MELQELDLSAEVWRGRRRSFRAATVMGRCFGAFRGNRSGGGTGSERSHMGVS